MRLVAARERDLWKSDRGVNTFLQIFIISLKFPQNILHNRCRHPRSKRLHHPGGGQTGQISGLLMGVPVGQAIQKCSGKHIPRSVGINGLHRRGVHSKTTVPVANKSAFGSESDGKSPGDPLQVVHGPLQAFGFSKQLGLGLVAEQQIHSAPQNFL